MQFTLREYFSVQSVLAHRVAETLFPAKWAIHYLSIKVIYITGYLKHKKHAPISRTAYGIRLGVV